MHARVSVDPAPARSLPVVLVHSIGVASRFMVPVAEVLAPYHRVYAPDLPGFGESGKPAHALSLVDLEQPVALTNEREEALRLARSYLSRYLKLPNYRNSWLRQGFEEEDLSGVGSERLAEGMVAWGAEGDIRERPHEHLSAGADQVCVQVVTDGPLSGLREQWRSLAPALLE